MKAKTTLLRSASLRFAVVGILFLLSAQGCAPATIEPAAPAELSVKQTDIAKATMESTARAAEEKTPLPTVELPPVDLDDRQLIRQGARFGSLTPQQVEDVAVGRYDPNYPSCGEPSLADLPEEGGEMILTLTYTTPVMPERIEIYHSGQIDGLRRVEALNAFSGLGRVLYESGDAVTMEPLTEGACSERLVFPGGTDFEVDTLILSFDSPAAAAQVAAVELWGRLEAYVNVPVFWRAPLENTPVDLAITETGMVYAATEPNGLYLYDFEGVQFKEYSAPDEAQLTSVAADLFGNLIVTDSTFGWFMVISPEEEQLAIGDADSCLSSAVNPADGNLYLLKRDGIDVFTTDTAELIRQMPLDAAGAYAGLAFDPQGKMYTLRDFNWQPVLAQLDPLTGDELDGSPLARSSQGEIVARDLAIDGNGYFYVLFQMNTGQVAVHKLDSQVNLVARFGGLAGDLEEWEPGVFMDPRAIAVDAAGGFIYVADGFGGSAFLTAFLTE
ncbi:MAG: hypothetical protein JW987_05820 [Anaerolineaceae bacterium]|nr:hypothetical protein [Anaerolineaceae bacterium]